MFFVINKIILVAGGIVQCGETCHTPCWCATLKFKSRIHVKLQILFFVLFGTAAISTTKCK